MKLMTKTFPLLNRNKLKNKQLEQKIFKIKQSIISKKKLKLHIVLFSFVSQLNDWVYSEKGVNNPYLSRGITFSLYIPLPLRMWVVYSSSIVFCSSFALSGAFLSLTLCSICGACSFNSLHKLFIVFLCLSCFDVSCCFNFSKLSFLMSPKISIYNFLICHMIFSAFICRTSFLHL